MIRESQHSFPIPTNLDTQVTLRALFVAHFLLITFVLFGQWVPLAYVWYSWHGM
jgi:hypothetical protein